MINIKGTMSIITNIKEFFFGKEDKFIKEYEKKYDFYLKLQKKIKDSARKDYKDNIKENNKIIEDITNEWLEYRKKYGYPDANNWIISTFKSKAKDRLIGQLESKYAEVYDDTLTEEQKDILDSNEFQDDEMEYMRLKDWDSFDLGKLANAHQHMKGERCSGLLQNCLCVSCGSLSAFSEEKFKFTKDRDFTLFDDLTNRY